MMRLVAVFALASLFAACGEDSPKEIRAAYCEEIQEQQEPLTESLAEGGPTALIAALPSFESLAATAPRDIVDEWATVIDAISGLVDVLDSAGVDPATYDRANPPEGLSEEEKTAIDVAGGELTSPATILAFEDVQQHARDICKTPLSF